MSDYFTDPYTRCPYRAGWCEKEADHEGSHYTTYRDGELWTMPAAAPADIGLPPPAPTADPFRWSWKNGAWHDTWPAAPAEGLERIRGTLEWLRDHGYQPGYNGRPSCPFCENFVDEEEGHDTDCALVYALARHESAGRPECDPPTTHRYDLSPSDPFLLICRRCGKERAA